MWSDLTDSTLKRKQTGLSVLAKAGEPEMRTVVSALIRTREQIRGQLTSLSLRGLI